MSRKSNLDKFHEMMFTDMDELTNLSKKEKDQLRRYRFAFTILLDAPSTSDNKLRDALMTEYSISQTQAYRDISNIKIILPNIRNSGKEWVRYVVNEELKQAIADAKSSDKIEARIMAIDKLAKYNRLDQIDDEEMPWNEIVPVPIEPTSDPTVLGITPMKNKEEEIKKLYEKYKGEIEIEDIDYQEFENGG